MLNVRLHFFCLLQVLFFLNNSATAQQLNNSNTPTTQKYFLEIDREAEEKTELKRLLQERLAFLGGNKYLVSLSEQEKASLLSRFPLAVASLYLVPAQYCLSDQWNTIPTNQVEVNAGVLLMPNADYRNLLNYCKRSGFAIIDTIGAPNWLELKLPYSALLQLSAQSEVQFLEPLLAATEIRPEYSPNMIRQGSLNLLLQSGTNLTGNGIKVALGDDGPLVPHIDLSQRVFQNSNAGAANNLHGELMAGIIAGAGNRDPSVLGAAPHAMLYIQNDQTAVKNAILNYTEHGVTLTNTSLSDGCNRGYTALTALADRQLSQYPMLMHIFSAGNAGLQDCQYGAGPGWGNITGGIKTAKNVITVGSVNSQYQLAATSSRGPSTDGRIKPDIVTVGEYVKSLTIDNNYDITSGTSGAAAATTGALAQLYEGWQSLYPNETINAAVIKAAVLNTADDLGNLGPDYKFGWGSLRADKAWDILQDGTFETFTLFDNENKTFIIDVPPTAIKTRLMLYWQDLEASPNNPHSLVNDLDLSVQTPDGLEYLPWVLSHAPDPTLLAAPATSGFDRVNNVEQIVLTGYNNEPINVNIHGYNIPSFLQRGVLVWQFEYDSLSFNYPLNFSVLASEEKVLLTWQPDEYSTETYELAISNNQGSSWEILSILDPTVTSYSIQTAATDSLQEIWFRIRHGNIEDVKIYYNAPKMSLPIIDFVCPDSVDLHWASKPQAIGYEIYRLDNGHMEVVQFVNDTFARVANNTLFQNQWFAVGVVYPNELRGLRSNAIEAIYTATSCPPKPDLSINSIISPANLNLQGCFSGTNDLVVGLFNPGLPANGAYQVFAQIDNIAPIAVNVNIPLPPGVTIPVVLPAAIPSLPAGQHGLKVWVNYPQDLAHYNDTLNTTLHIINSPLVTVPQVSTFDDLPFSSNPDNCGQTEIGGPIWYNEPNQNDEILDWVLTNRSQLPNAALPISDYNLANNDGRYLMIRHDDACSAGKGTLLSPCVNLANATQPKVRVWIYFSGKIGERVYIDVFHNNQWESNQLTVNASEVVTNQWLPIELNLAEYIGQVISVRLRGWTGLTPGSFVLLDKAVFYDSSKSPIADFGLPNHVTCPNAPVQLLNHTINGQSFKWTISPSSFEYLPGFDENSESPQIKFTVAGNYLVKLKASNNNGSDSLLRINAITVQQGDLPPIANSFEDDQTLPLLTFGVINPDNSIGWEPFQDMVGHFNNNNRAIGINNHGYYDIGQQDEFITKLVYLPNNIPMQFQFDYAYTSFNANYTDGLRVALSQDCGITYSELLFEESGVELSTSEPQPWLFIPNEWQDWRTASIPLNDYAGKSVLIKFTATNGFGNNLYLDNLLIAAKAAIPTISAALSADTTCINTFIAATAEILSGNAQETYWQFDPNASQETINALNGEISYSVQGLHHCRFVACNDLGCFEIRDSVHTLAPPVAVFDYQLNDLEVVFINNSQNETDWIWDFGDGQVTDGYSPTHTYQSYGDYLIELAVSNVCGMVTQATTIFVDGSTTAVEDLEPNWLVYPNPTNGSLMLLGDILDVKLELFDINGRVLPFTYNKVDHQQIDCSLNDKPQGVYLLRILSKSKVETVRVVKI